MTTYYSVSSPNHDSDSPHSRDWPRRFNISFEAEEVQLIQGKGHGLGGGYYTFDEFRVSKWPEFFDGWDTDWLVDALSGHDSLTLLDEAEFVRTLNSHAPLETRDF